MPAIRGDFAAADVEPVAGAQLGPDQVGQVAQGLPVIVLHDCASAGSTAIRMSEPTTSALQRLFKSCAKQKNPAILIDFYLQHLVM